jgi:hypothetical protein
MRLGIKSFLDSMSALGFAGGRDLCSGCKLESLPAPKYSRRHLLQDCFQLRGTSVVTSRLRKTPLRMEPSSRKLLKRRQISGCVELHVACRTVCLHSRSPVDPFCAGFRNQKAFEVEGVGNAHHAQLLHARLS